MRCAGVALQNIVDVFQRHGRAILPSECEACMRWYCEHIALMDEFTEQWIATYLHVPPAMLRVLRVARVLRAIRLIKSVPQLRRVLMPELRRVLIPELRRVLMPELRRDDESAASARCADDVSTCAATSVVKASPRHPWRSGEATDATDSCEGVDASCCGSRSDGSSRFTASSSADITSEALPWSAVASLSPSPSESQPRVTWPRLPVAAQPVVSE